MCVDCGMTAILEVRDLHTGALEIRVPLDCSSVKQGMQRAAAEYEAFNFRGGHTVSVSIRVTVP